jgi:hypothetical protein
MSPGRGKMSSTMGKHRQGETVRKKDISAIVSFAAAFLVITALGVNQITSSSIPTSIYTPGPHQPAPTASATPLQHPHPTATSSAGWLQTTIASPTHATQYGVRHPLRKHAPSSPVTHRPTHRPTPRPIQTLPTVPRLPKLPEQPRALCSALGILGISPAGRVLVCASDGSGQGVWRIL